MGLESGLLYNFLLLLVYVLIILILFYLHLQLPCWISKHKNDF